MPLAIPIITGVAGYVYGAFFDEGFSWTKAAVIMAAGAVIVKTVKS